MKIRNARAAVTARHKLRTGFSLVELMVAMAVFMVIGGAAVALVKMHVPLFTAQQNQTGLNLSMRNGVAQMQIDVVNAGTGYYQGVNIPSWPIGITVINSAPGTGCYNAATSSYGPGCFDRLNVIAIDQNTPPSNPQDIGANCIGLGASASSLFVMPTGTTTLAQLAADFHTGDEILVVKSDGSQMTTAVLTSDGQVTGGKVKLAHIPVTPDDGTNPNDPLGIATTPSNKLGSQFCNTDWVLKIAPITYWVDASDPTNPKLTRTQGGQATVLAEQIIGFKVGAALWNGTTDNTYNFDNTSYSDWSLIRSVRISMIGRTAADVSSNFRNTFDGGAYKIESVSVVINPRNLSMND
ncbi:MAG TPA: prepilin-type N-terminal cleavage/methylation domain-containing protein [Candidatus Angelobacter sp.]|jgi:prepilin-type N-terminal cleavage/methylation domain-containing protein